MFSIQLSTLLFAVLFSAHIIACFWYLLGAYDHMPPAQTNATNTTTAGGPTMSTISTAAASDEGGFGAVTAALGPYGEELGAALGVSQHTAMLGVDPEKVGWVHRVVVSQLQLRDDSAEPWAVCARLACSTLLR